MNLLILGNGFDLHCNVQSTFSDFFTNYDNFCNKKSIRDAKIIVSNLSKGLFTYVDFNQSSNDEQINLLGKYSNQFGDILNKYKNGSMNHVNVNFFLLYFYLLKVDQKYLVKNSSLYNWTDIENQLYIFLSKYSTAIKWIIYYVCKILNNTSNKLDINTIFSMIGNFHQKYHIKLNFDNFCILTMTSSIMLMDTGIIRYNNKKSSFNNFDFYDYIWYITSLIRTYF